MPNKVFPSELWKPVHQFTQAIRMIGYCGTDKRIRLYRSFLRTNIAGVLETTFPLLNAMLSSQEKTKLIDHFMAQHPAQEPEFHQIASELVVFFQTSHLLVPNFQALAEYEWLLFDKEISNEKAYPVTQMLLKETTVLLLNPTLQSICLPWKIGSCGPKWNMPGSYYYAIYRDIENVVMRKELSQIDLIFIHLLDNGNALSLSELTHRLNTLSKESIYQWINIHRANGLVYTAEIG